MSTMVATYLHPGIFIEELYGSREPVRGVEPTSTRVPPGGSVLKAEQSTAAFLGYAEQGPVGEPVWIASWREYQRRFRDDRPPGVLAAAVEGYFDNGGRLCVVSRLDPDAPIVPAVHGEPGSRTGLAGLAAVGDVATVCAPDLATAVRDGRLDLDGLHAAQLGLVTHCELMGDRIAILDPPPGLGPEKIHSWRTERGIDSAYAVLPYPWIKIAGPDGDRLWTIPPSGHLAGSYARLDGIRGFHRAPANDPLTGVVDLETHLTGGELDLLCPLGVNCLMAAPGRGVVSWGARTLSADPARRQLRRRRLLNVLSRTIRGALAWTVFEPAADQAVWALTADRLRELFYLYWRAGALDGASPEEAFAVRCDRETNPADAIEAGVVTAEVVLATDPPASLLVISNRG
jgi:uncharacterized protein